VQSTVSDHFYLIYEPLYDNESRHWSGILAMQKGEETLFVIRIIFSGKLNMVYSYLNLFYSPKIIKRVYVSTS
jgi:hypothetical protein